jgi:hypothetical protein
MWQNRQYISSISEERQFSQRIVFERLSCEPQLLFSLPTEHHFYSRKTPAVKFLLLHLGYLPYTFLKMDEVSMSLQGKLLMVFVASEKI